MRWKQVGPSEKLHANFYGKHGPPINMERHRRRYVEEMQGVEQQESIAVLAEQLAAGKTITWLCSSACVDATHCHRTLLRELIELAAGKLVPAERPGSSPP